MNIWGFPSDGIAGRTFSQYAEGATEVKIREVQRSAAHRAKALRFSNASEDAAPGSQKMACLRMTFEAN
jgi:hypothetical protein